MKFQKATKKQSHARVALIGISGSGKTYGALRVANGLVPGGRIAVIDSERGSASKYSDVFAFDVLELESFAPLKYVDAIDAAAAEKYDVLIIDSLSHAWMGKDGALEQVDRRANGAGSSFNAWRDVTPMHNKLVDALLRYPGHLIVTMRAKAEYVVEQNGKGKSVPRKVGMAPVQRDGLEYEFDLVVDIAGDQSAIVSKTRCTAFNGQAIELLTEDTGATLRAWLTDGAPMAERKAAPSGVGKLPAAAPAAQATAAQPPATTFDLPSVLTRISMAGSRESAIAIAAAAGVPDQSLQVRQRVRQAIEVLTAELEKEGERGATPAADVAPPADQPAGTESGPASVPEHIPSDPVVDQAPANDAAPTADPAWVAVLAELAPVVGADTAGWSTDDVMAEFATLCEKAEGRAAFVKAATPWITVTNRGRGPIAGEVRRAVKDQFDATVAALRAREAASERAA